MEAGIDALRQKVPKSRFAFKKKAGPLSTTTPTPPTLPQPTATNTTTYHETSASTSTPTSHLQFTNKTNTYITSQSDTSAQEIILRELDSCIVDLIGAGGLEVTALYAKGLRRCVVVCGLVKGSVRMEECKECVVVVGCHQVCSVDDCKTSLE